MPRGDGTGPGGMGPMTGRGAGYCAGYPVPGYMNPYGGRGMGWGRGGGMGMAWRRGWGGGWGRGGWGSAPPAYPPMPFPQYGPDYGPAVAAGAPSPEDEIQMLRGQADWLKQQMDAITGRIQELEQPKEE